MRFKRFPTNCTQLGPAQEDATWSFTNFFVMNNRFSFDGDSGDAHLEFKGTFKQGGKKIEGKLKSGPTDGGPGVGICTSPRRNYDAKRGAKGPHPQPKAKIHRAFRVAG